MTVYFFMLFFLLSSNGENTVELHDFHLSKSTINYNSEEKAIQITLYMFLDDLEDGLRARGFDSLQLCTSLEKQNAEGHLIDYVSDHYHIQLDGGKTELSFIGKEISEDLAAVWCYFEITNIGNPNEIIISNDILLEIFDDQKNMVTIQRNKNRVKDILFDKDKLSSKITI